MATSDNQDSLFADSSIVTPEVVQDSSPVPAPITTRRQLVGSKIQPWDILYSLLFATSAFFAVFLFTVCFIAVAFWCARRFCQGFSGRKTTVKEESGMKLSRQRSQGSTGGAAGGGGGTKRKFLTPAFSSHRTSAL
ncbi:uncharacterized protein LOC142351346 [Convolutriloba macropyga]|uniref:uncharacterized protein LOC142351346 n=1 Tax=Convolutriloba macropyga TaxID=536237 RepID=UPI003F51B206